MSEPIRIRVDAYIPMSSLIDAILDGAEIQPYSVGVYYAEKLERAAKLIREANEEKPNGA